MNIIVGVLTIAAAIWLRTKFRSCARAANSLFTISLMVGLISILTVRGTSIWAELGFGLLAAAVSLLILTFYKIELNRALRRQKSYSPIARAPRAEKIPSLAEQTRRLGRISAIAALNEYADGDSEAA